MIKYLKPLFGSRMHLWLLFSDFVFVPLALWCAFSLRFGTWYVPTLETLILFLSAPVLAIPIFLRLGLYRAVVRYLGYRAIWVVIKAVSISLVAWTLMVYLSDLAPLVPQSVVFLFFLMALFLVGGSRFLIRALIWMPRGHVHRALIYGAGTAGAQLASALRYGHEVMPVAFIDDDPKLHGLDLAGLRIFAPNEIEAVIRFIFKVILVDIADGQPSVGSPFTGILDRPL